MTEPFAYTVDEAARLSGLCRRSIYNRIKSGDLVARKNGKLTIILATDLRAWLESLPRMQPATNAQ